MKSLILVILLSSLSIAQNDDPLSYFPYKTGDMWEYFWDDSQYPDTVQNFNIHDSVDAEGNIHLTQIGRSINPISPAILLPDTGHFKIDTNFNVFGPYIQWGPGAEHVLLYKLTANQGDQWIIHTYQDSTNIYGYEIARVQEVWEDVLFGVQTNFKAYVYYNSTDSSDTTGLGRYGDVLALGFGLWSRGGGDLVGDIFLKGCTINDTLYGDTTNIITSVKDLSNSIISDFRLYPNYPNPFNPSTTIGFKINNSNSVSLIVYDAMGQEVKRLIDNEYLFSGTHELTWNGKNNSDQSVSSGVYYYQLLNGTVKITRSMILIK
jgi:flagellar hook capping protein FlgD